MHLEKVEHDIPSTLGVVYLSEEKAMVMKSVSEPFRSAVVGYVLE